MSATNSEEGPFASVVTNLSISLYPVPGLALWLSLEAINPKLNLFGFSSSKLDMAIPYCADPPGL